MRSIPQILVILHLVAVSVSANYGFKCDNDGSKLFMASFELVNELKIENVTEQTFGKVKCYSSNTTVLFNLDDGPQGLQASFEFKQLATEKFYNISEITVEFNGTKWLSTQVDLHLYSENSKLRTGKEAYICDVFKTPLAPMGATNSTRTANLILNKFYIAAFALEDTQLTEIECHFDKISNTLPIIVGALLLCAVAIILAIYIFISRRHSQQNKDKK